MVEFFTQTYFKDHFGECRMRNGVRINPLQKRLCIICIQIRREFLIEIMLFFVMSIDYDYATRITYTEIDACFTRLGLQTRWARAG
jgi:hypothetical protein